jgi:hypothetical protein
MITTYKDKVMKNIITILTIIPIIAFASLNVQKVTNTLSNITGNKTISFFNANSHIHLNGKIRLTSLNSADIVLFSSKKHKSKLTIVNSYKKLKLNKNSIGAIYLKKGRTQIIFIKERLDANGLILNSKFKKHILHEWQLNPKSLMNNLK